MSSIAPVYLALGVMLGACLLAVLLWPRRGLLARRRQRRANAGRVRREDALKHLCQTEAGGRRPTLESVAGALHLPRDETGRLLHEMEQAGLLTFASGELELTPPGRAVGAQVIRAHRLWECHLAENTGLRETEWHAQAEQHEHALSPGETDALSAQLGHPTHDPHGDPIPSAQGVMSADGGRPLTTLATGESAVIVHLEDEPASHFAQLAALNLRPGMRVKILERDGQRIRFEADGSDHELAPILAHQIEVLPRPETDDDVEPLAAFNPGERATVVGLARSCRGPERRRLLDLGFVAGTPVEVEMTSPSGEPTAYRVRGTVIALHREQARLVQVKRAEEKES